ncbi:hypothetical protein NHE_0602 [Neorickettsia helminthoeca str. Oregon]|uniref:Alpha/beta hydrolase family protein n=1 Tax=Neorickettsia helminthoeca str. Oregon TaxID=1286528 RepID=X5HKH6_9RICK|nr:hypothetical protein [Neorickettsia helminthoeca]AHX11539.1 hypothetical protein NHE_0602 [Neorickettsia helminthoeca str. Oregon]
MQNIKNETGLLSSFLHSLLIPGNSESGATWISGPHKFWVKYEGDAILAASPEEANAFELSFGFVDLFNPSKPTVLFFSGNGGRINERFSEMRRYCNVVTFNYLKYGCAHRAVYRYMGGKLSLSNLVQQSEVLLKNLEALLRSSQYYGRKYNRSNDLVLYGKSLGGMVSTKLAAKLEESGERCAKLITLVAPPNMKYAARTLLNRSRGAHLIFVACALLLLGTVTGALYGIIRGAISDDQSRWITVACSITLCLALCIAVLKAVICITVVQYGSKIGITQDEIDALNDTPVSVIVSDGDIFYEEGDIRETYRDGINADDLERRENVKIAVIPVDNARLRHEYKLSPFLFRAFHALLVHNSDSLYEDTVMGEIRAFVEERRIRKSWWGVTSILPWSHLSSRASNMV